MDEAFVEDTKQHVGGEDRRQQQNRLALLRIFEHLRRALETAHNVVGDRFAGNLLDRALCGSKRDAGH
jgi:hypothetical protein